MTVTGHGTGFRRLGERTVHEGHVITVAVGTFAAPDGTTFERDVVHHPGAVGVVAVDGDGFVSLVRQYRPVVDAEILEIPAGVRDQPDEEPLQCARRELREEVGLAAATWAPLARFHVAPGFSDEVFHLFLAQDLTTVPRDVQGVEEEAMTIERVSLADVPDLIADGTLADAKTITGLLLARELR